MGNTDIGTLKHWQARVTAQTPAERAPEPGALRGSQASQTIRLATLTVTGQAKRTRHRKSLPLRPHHLMTCFALRDAGQSLWRLCERVFYYRPNTYRQRSN